MTNEILDSRDLEDELTQLLEDKENGDDYDQDRLKALEELKAELEGCGWEYGIALIPESEWQDYAEELFDECYAGRLPDSIKNYIDYEQFAEDLTQDYSIVTFEDVDYYWREA